MTFRDLGRPTKPPIRGSASGPRSGDFRPQTPVATLPRKPSPQIALVFNDSIIQEAPLSLRDPRDVSHHVIIKQFILLGLYLLNTDLDGTCHHQQLSTTVRSL